MDPFFYSPDMNLTPNKRICDIKPGDKNIDMKVILTGQGERNKIKRETKLTQFMVSDITGSIKCNFFDETGDMLNEGDIIFLKGAYASIFKNKLILYASKLGSGQVIKVSEFFMTFNETPNLTDLVWKKVRDEKSGMEVYVVDNSI